MRIGIVCSSGGSVFRSAYQILNDCGFEINAVVVTDRECGIESYCTKVNIPARRIEEPSREVFSAAAFQWLCEVHKVEWVALFFSRLVDKALYSRVPCVNFHPSLLPSFPGFGALKNVLNTGVKFFGATAHFVNESIDAGPILAQTISPVPVNASLECLERISFAQKLYLFLVIYEKALAGQLENLPYGEKRYGFLNYTTYAFPKLCSAAIEAKFMDFMLSEGIQWPPR